MPLVLVVVIILMSLCYILPAVIRDKNKQQ